MKSPIRSVCASLRSSPPSCAYPYHGSGYGDDANLYFYLPYGKYRMNGKSCVVNETGVHFPGMVIIVK